MRINIIPVNELMDQHLVAEYREIKMLPKALFRSIRSKKGLVFCDVPLSFTLNAGHGKFFYNKLCFIIDRFEALLSEMFKRGFAVNSSKLFYDDYDYICIHDFKEFNLFAGYVPDDVALKINRNRITQRISERPGFYKYYGKSV